MARIEGIEARNGQPAPSVAIFSSFRKFMSQVTVAHEIFTEYGILVSTPPSLVPIGPAAEFVRFPEDEPDLSDAAIQRRVLVERAAGSTAVYVVCPGGYMGSAVSYEVGWGVSNGWPLYFSERPRHSFIEPHVGGRIVNPHELSGMINQGTVTPIEGPSS